MKTKTITLKKILALVFSTTFGYNSIAQVPLVFNVENRTPASGCVTTAGNTNTTLASLPDPFSFTNGGRVATFDDWTCRRNQIKSDIENYEIGPKPAKPASVTATFTGNNSLKIISTVGSQTLTQTVTVSIPSGTGPFPVIIGMNSATGGLGAGVFSGCITINYAHDQVVTYNGGSGAINSADPYFKLYPSTNIGKYSAWSWGISRIIDGLELMKTEMKVDLTKIAVTGCSYAGKMALFAGAFDERIALTIAQESGGGGINSWRMSKAYTTRTSVNVEKIDNTNYSWFKSSMKNLTPETLPHDHHELIAMIAPRALLVLGNPTQEWLCDESGYKACVAADEVWKSMGVSDRFGWVFTPGHAHCSPSADQTTASTTFVNKFLKGTTASTNIRTNPTQGTQQNLTIGTGVINWATPTITFPPSNPNIPSVKFTAPTATSFDAPATVDFAVTATDADNNVTKVEFLNGTAKLGEDLIGPSYTFSMPNLGPGSYTITAKVTDASSNTSSTTITFIVSAAPLQIFKAASAPTIDGTIDQIWNDNSIVSMLASTNLVGTISNNADLAATAKFLWDNTNIYVLAVVTDDTKKNDSPNAYEDDAIEIYFDINNDKATAYAANDVQYTFGWNDGTTVGVLPSGRSTTGITYFAVSTTNGYIIEAKIPWATLTGTPADGQKIGIDFMINDDDDAAAARDTKISWNSATDQAYTDPSLFGTATLKSNLVTAVKETEQVAINVFPNPATTKIYVSGVSGSFQYTITNQLGDIVDSGTSIEGSIDVTDFAKGAYILSISQENKKAVSKILIAK